MDRRATQIRDGKVACFKAYDARGRVPDELDEALAVRIGKAYAEVVRPNRVVVGHDIRLSSPSLSAALIEGLERAGVDVAFLGECGTEEIYFATAELGLDGGIMVTASHNPKDYNGMKFVKAGARPISADTGLEDIARLAATAPLPDAPKRGTTTPLALREDFVSHVLGFIDHQRQKPLKLVVNSGNGCAGPVFDALAERLPFEVVRLQHTPDGHFPNGVPNPLLTANRAVTAEAVVHAQADLGIAWDGDFDRCFFFDETGRFIEGYYIVGLLAEQVLAKNPGGRVVHDPRLIWNTIEIVRQCGGEPVVCKSGHAFIKEKMRAVDAVYGGEMSAHHYFKDFAYADSGMIPWLLVAENIGQSGRPLSALVDERIRRFPISGELNREVEDPVALLRTLRAHYAPQAEDIDGLDGLSITLDRWRFNMRASNTEPVVRLNVESRGDQALLEDKTAEVLEFMSPIRGAPYEVPPTPQELE